MSTNPETIHVAFGCDARYVQPLAVALRSVIQSAREPRHLHFWVVSASLDHVKVQSAATLAQAVGSRFTLLQMTDFAHLLETVPSRGHISTAAYYRLLLPEVMPPSVTKLIYLDCDIVVRHPIEELWATSLNGFAIAAVMKPRALEYADVGLAAETDYFNSGVMVLDLPVWRAAGIRQAAFDFAMHHPGRVHGHDQPALNHVLAGRWQRLDPRWNQQFKFFVHTAGYLHMTSADLHRLRTAPFIIHYTTGAKPWHAGNDHPLREEYFKVLNQTPYAGWRPARGTVVERIRFSLRRCVPHPVRPGVLRNVYRPHFHRWKTRVVGWLQRTPRAVTESKAPELIKRAATRFRSAPPKVLRGEARPGG